MTDLLQKMWSRENVSCDTVNSFTDSLTLPLVHQQVCIECLLSPLFQGLKIHVCAKVFFFLNPCSWDFPDGPVVKTLCFQCEGMGLIPGRATKIPHAVEQLSPVP